MSLKNVQLDLIKWKDELLLYLFVLKTNLMYSYENNARSLKRLFNIP